MSCKTHDDLELDLKSARNRYAQYAYKQNRYLWGVSDHKAAQIAKEKLDG